MRSTSSSPIDTGRSAGPLGRAIVYLAFLFTPFLPWMLLVRPLRSRFGDGERVAIVVLGLFVALAWNAAAARRIGSHRWPMAISTGLAVVVAGFFIDSFMSVAAIWLSLQLA